MTDFYALMTGRPSPGRTSNREFRRYIDGGENAEEVARASERVEANRNRRLPEVEIANLPQPEPPRRAPLVTGDHVTAAVRDVGGYVQDYIEDGVPHNSYRRPDAPPVRSQPRQRAASDDPLDVIDDPSIAPVGDRTPYSALTGRDVAPFGEDFLTWYEATRYGESLLPPALRAVEGPGPDINPETNPGHEPRIANNQPLGIEGGTRQVPTRLERGANDRAPTVSQTFEALPRRWDAVRRAGIEPDIDPTQAWIDAEERAGVRWLEGRPSVTDMVFAAIFGQRAIAPERLEEARTAAGKDAPKITRKDGMIMTPAEIVSQANERDWQVNGAPSARVDPATGWPLDPVTGEPVAPLEWERMQQRDRQQQQDDEARVRDRTRFEPASNGIRIRRRF